MIASLGARVHLFVRPRYRERFVALFRDVLGSNVRELDFGMEHPIVLVAFPDGSAFSVEFSDLACEERTTVDDATAFRGAWIEFRVENTDAAQSALRQAGFPSFTHPGSKHAYFVAPGGQVFRVIDIGYTGP